MSIRGFHHLAVQVRSVEHVAAFYREVLGLPEQTRYLRSDGTVRSIWMSLPGGFLALEQAEGEVESQPFRHSRLGLHLIALRIHRSDRAAWLSRLAQRGVRIEHETRWSFYIRDPEGNRIGISHHPED